MSFGFPRCPYIYRNRIIFLFIHEESEMPHHGCLLTFTHDSVRFILSSDGPDSAGFSWAEVLLKR